ncbi:hypothetical protein [Marinospirillum insulare]|uniref:Entry exclusion lipoprotein TrbK n=1 Tax=Marinospirillum insulare TaxID=217169 RepID=A0ABQ5ZZ12_9GAMM|nr:hypothetical protein [Marinospirillum insulare]GLR64622.1 hypothetical protein GCM10007878_20600 [Marinospirillum insulare]
MKKVLMMFGVTIIAGVLLTGCSKSQAEIEEEAKELATACIEQMQKNPITGGESKACKEVEKFAKKHGIDF